MPQGTRPYHGVSIGRPSLACVALTIVLGAGCDAPKADRPGFGALPAEVMRLAQQIVPEFDEYLASVTSRRAITLFPQVSGYVRAIRAKSGDQVARGRVLVDIDPGPQVATLESLQATVANKRAALSYAAKEDERSRALVAAGVLSRLDYDQRHNAFLTAEADVRAATAQVRAQTDLLQFYRVAAPTDGVLGDVPVKIGDYVSPQTRLTSISQANFVEAYIYVPVAKANAIRPDANVELLDDGRQVLCREHPSFVSPDVSVETQTVLVKAICPNEGSLRSSEVVRARVIWEERPGVTIPISAVTRLSGQYFVFVAARSSKGTIARQRPITVGAIRGNDFVVREGLGPGTEVVVSNIQKIRDGTPIHPLPAGAARRSGAER
jgi:RND family efflux transporter MFP subunit